MKIHYLTSGEQQPTRFACNGQAAQSTQHYTTKRSEVTCKACRRLWPARTLTRRQEAITAAFQASVHTVMRQHLTEKEFDSVLDDVDESFYDCELWELLIDAAEENL